MSKRRFATLEEAFAHYAASAADPTVSSDVRYWHDKTARKAREDITARDAGNPYRVQKNVVGFHYTQGYFPSLYHARLFVDAMPPDAGGEKVEIVHTLEVVYTRPPPWRDPTICHQCGKKLPDGCNGAERDDMGCMWDQPSLWPEWLSMRAGL